MQRDQFAKLPEVLQTQICSYLCPDENARMAYLFRIKLFPATPDAYFQMVYPEVTVPDWIELDIGAKGNYALNLKSVDRYFECKNKSSPDFIAVYELISKRQLEVNSGIEYAKMDTKELSRLSNGLELDFTKTYKVPSVASGKVIIAHKLEKVRFPITKLSFRSYEEIPDIRIIKLFTKTKHVLFNVSSDNVNVVNSVLKQLEIDTLELDIMSMNEIEVPKFIRNLIIADVTDVTITHKLEKLTTNFFYRDSEYSRTLHDSEEIILSIQNIIRTSSLKKTYTVDFRSVFKNLTLSKLHIKNRSYAVNFYFGKVPESLTTLTIDSPIRYMMIGKNHIEHLILTESYKQPRLDIFPSLKYLTLNRIRADYVLPELDELTVTGWDLDNELPNLKCKILISHGPIKISKLNLAKSRIRSVSAIQFNVF